MKKVRVRYAPSPTGLLHIGNARTALFNYLFAKKYHGDFIIRIEDTDIARNVKDGEKSQLNYLAWLGIQWDESPLNPGKYGPYRQLERLDIYKKYAQELLDKGLAYKDFKDNSEEYALRIKVPDDEIYEFNDLVRGKLSFASKEVEDWVIIKDNGIPTYNFAVVVDDHLMEITHVLRGEEHITNTPKQIMLYKAFGWDIPEFGHMAIIVNENGKKLSKRDNDVMQFISQYDEKGYLPEALFNFIALLGFSPQENEEILSKEQLIEIFDSKRLSKAPAMFDVAKLTYINNRYIKKLPTPELAKLVKPYFIAQEIPLENDVWLEKLCEILKDRLNYLEEIIRYYHEFFRNKYILTNEAIEFFNKNRVQNISLVSSFKEKLATSSFSTKEIEKIIEEVGLTLGIKGKDLYIPLRISTTGDIHGPSLPISLNLLGKDLIISRLNMVLKKTEV